MKNYKDIYEEVCKLFMNDLCVLLQIHCIHFKGKSKGKVIQVCTVLLTRRKTKYFFRIRKQRKTHFYTRPLHKIALCSFCARRNTTKIPVNNNLFKQGSNVSKWGQQLPWPCFLLTSEYGFSLAVFHTLSNLIKIL